MQNSTALYCVDVTTPDDAIKAAARAAAKHNMHLAVLLHAEFPTLPLNAYGALPYGSVTVPDAWPDTLRAAQTGLTTRVDAIEALLAEEGVSADVRPLFATGPDTKRGIAIASRACDVAFLAPDMRQHDTVFREMLHSVLFESPIAAVVNGTPEMVHKTVLLAWNDSLASARAAHLALPYLKDADTVRIACFDVPSTDIGTKIEPGQDVAAWLSHHGCNVTLTQLPSGGREIGTCILDHAGEIGADLIVAGAYGHSRLQQAVFGGTSRTLIEQTKMPVFMAH